MLICPSRLILSALLEGEDGFMVMIGDAVMKDLTGTNVVENEEIVLRRRNRELMYTLLLF
jgi:hypothetical protein